VTDPDHPVRVRVERLVGGGRGLAHHAGETWMVTGALPGEEVDARPVGRRAGIVEAVAVGVAARPHPAREPSPCPRAPACGGCDWPHVSAAGGGPLKAEVAAGAARSHPELAAALARAPVRPSPPGYRLRARLHYDPGEGRLGFYAPRSWAVADITGCRIVSPTLTAELSRLEAALGACPAPVDVEWIENLEGTAAVAALRPSRRHRKAAEPPWVPPEASLRAGPVRGFHRLDLAGRVLEGWGATSVTMSLPVPLEVPVGAFFQGNRHLVPWLFHRVGELAGPDPGPTWDLHAGVGLLAAAVRAASGPPLVAVEPFRPAAHAAVRNLPGARVVVGRTAEAYLSRAGRLPRRATAIVDPPRSGLGATLRATLAGWGPERLLMLGCDAATWARDAAFLLHRGYRLVHLELVDLFPSTHHVEVLAVLERQ